VSGGGLEPRGIEALLRRGPRLHAVEEPEEHRLHGLALYLKKALAEDAHVSAEGSGFGGITLARNLPSKAAVDAALETAVKAGAKILNPAQEVFWGGYSGYFADPDGYPWEIAFNPHWKLDENGGVRLPP
jgi:uncharacterized glyoxalase superfamily protein PhnB